MKRPRIRRRCEHLPQCPLCHGVTNRTYLATRQSHAISATAELCLSCWIDKKREDQPG